jgi:hypothetical protein
MPEVHISEGIKMFKLQNVWQYNDAYALLCKQLHFSFQKIKHCYINSRAPLIHTSIFVYLFL